MAAVEQQLTKLIQEAKRLTSNEDFESCTQWVDREIARTKKLADQIERLSKTGDIPSKLFNEARDMSDELSRHVERLRSFRSNMSRMGKQVVLNSYEDARNSDILKSGSINTEFKCPCISSNGNHGCPKEESICKIDVQNETTRFPSAILHYHVDFIANHHADSLSLVMYIKTRDEHDSSSFYGYGSYQDDMFDPVAKADNICQSNIDVCPTQCNKLYHVAYGFHLNAIMQQDTGFHLLHNQEIQIQNRLYSETNKMLACFQHSIMLIKEPMEYALPHAYAIAKNNN